MRFLVAAAAKLDDPDRARLEQAILQGPPREMFKSDVEPERWNKIASRGIWLKLAKMELSGAILHKEAKDKLIAIGNENPEWKLAADERDEFPFWMDSGWSGNDDPWRKFVASPRRRNDLIAWLRQPPSSGPWQEDDWQQRCGDNFATTACSLAVMAAEGDWPLERWRTALQVWSTEKLLKRSWRCIAPIIFKAPDEFITACAHGIGWWIQAASKVFDVHESEFFCLTYRILRLLPDDAVATDDPVNRALNHPIGGVTQALLNWWYRQSLEDNQGLSEKIKPIFSALCDRHIGKFRHGRLLLATHSISLYRVDSIWTTVHLLPLFDWPQSESEASLVWKGFLWSPRLYGPLLEAIKNPMLDTAKHYDQLGDYARQYADFITFVALELTELFSRDELAQAIKALPKDGLQYSSQTLTRALESSGNQRGEYWHNRVLPFLKSIWPQSRDLMSPAIAENLARLCVAAGDAFPYALAKLKDWLMPIDYPDYIVHVMKESNLAGQFPVESLDLLNRLFGDQSQFISDDLNECLLSIRNANSALESDPRFRTLVEHVQRGR